MKIKPIKKLIYIHKRKKNETASETEMTEYDNILKYYKLEESDVEETVKVVGYNKNTSLSLAINSILKSGDEKSKLAIVFMILAIVVLHLFNKDKKE